jgi:hypothetical protein
MKTLVFAILTALAAAGWGSLALAQQVTVATPHPTVSHSFHEQFGVNWGIRGNGWFFNFGGPVAPPFGGFDPNAGATFGFGGPHGFLNITASQGSSTTFSGQTPMVTVANGGTAAFFDQTVRPFVTGVIPVVGGQPPAVGSVREERLSRLSAGEAAGERKASPAAARPAAAGGAGKGPSSAERGELSVAEIKARKLDEASSEDAAVAAEIEVLLEKARGAIEAGKPGVAKIHLQMAARRASGERQAAILKQLDELAAPGK